MSQPFAHDVIESKYRGYHKVKGSQHDDQLFGTEANDLIKPKNGDDVIVGGQGGIDVLQLRGYATSNATRSDWTQSADGLSGSTSANNNTFSYTFSKIDVLDFSFGSKTDIISYTITAFDPSRKFDINGGPGVQGDNILNLTVSAAVTESIELTVTDKGIMSNFGDLYKFQSGTVTGGSGDDTFTSFYRVANFSGGAGDDVLKGGESADVLAGGTGDDVLSGSYEDDLLIGGRGMDTLSGGRPVGSLTSADTFQFIAGDSAANRNRADLITDFSQSDHDRIDLAGYDAIEGTAKVDPFAFIGVAAFSGAAGELHFEIRKGETLLSGDTDGDRKADFTIRLTGEITLTAADFVFAPAALPVAAAHPFAAHVDLPGGHALPLA